MNKKILSLVALLISGFSYSQVGIGTLSPDNSAQLDVVSTNKGVLIPRVELESSIDASTITNGNVNSLLVFNTNTQNDIKPGYYYWYDNKWMRVVNHDDVVELDTNTTNTSLTFLNQELVLTDSDGNFVSVPISEINIITTLAYNAGENTLTYTGEDGLPVSLNLNEGLVAYESASNVLTYTDQTGAITPVSLNNTNLSYDAATSVLSYVNTLGLTQTINLTSIIQDFETLTNLTYVAATGIATYTNEAGTEQTIDLSEAVKDFETVTSITVDNTAGTLTYVDESGIPNVLNLESLVKVNETLTNLTYVESTGIATYTNEAGTAQNIDLSGLKIEPWNIQGTSDKATANTENIYQSGNVAIGFTDADLASDKKLEVKGDFKTNYKSVFRYGILSTGNANEEVVKDVGIDTNFEGSGQTMIYNADDITNLNTSNFSLLNISDQSAFLISKNQESSSSAGVSPNSVYLSSALPNQADGASIVRISPELISLQNDGNELNALQSQINIDNVNGVNFGFKKDLYSGNIQQYTFPTTSGDVGQVLAVDTSAAGTSTLAWTDIVSPSTEPWQVQGSTTQATSNTEHIYQQGKVAIGFTNQEINPDYTKQLQVQGDILAYNKDFTNNIGYVTEFNNEFGSVRNLYYDAGKQIVANGRVDVTSKNGTPIAALTAGTEIGQVSGRYNISTDIGMIEGEGIHSFRSFRKGTPNIDNSVVVMDVDGLKVGKYRVITPNGSDNPLSRMSFTQSDPEYVSGEDISFKVDSYTFPTELPTAGQFLTYDSETGGDLSAKSVKTKWASVQDVLKNQTQMPCWWYAPSTVLPTSPIGTLQNGISYNSSTGVYTVNLHQIYSSQFNMTGNVSGATRSAIKSAGATNLPVIAASQLEYFVTYFDNSVFDPLSITLSDSGVMTYRVLPAAQVTERTYMNITFKHKNCGIENGSGSGGSSGSARQAGSDSPF